MNLLTTGSAKKLIKWNDNNFIDSPLKQGEGEACHQEDAAGAMERDESQEDLEEKAVSQEEAETPQALVGPKDEEYSTNNKLLWNHTDEDIEDEILR